MAAPALTTRDGLLLEFDRLELLACGCVVASYRAWPWGVGVVAIEAKGPYCMAQAHEASHLLHFEELEDSAAGFGDRSSSRPR